jgi:hypothetical protein
MGRDEEDDTNDELLWDGTGARAGSGTGVAILVGRFDDERSAEGFLDNDRSLACGSFEAGAPVAGGALSSVLCSNFVKL